MGHVLIMSVIDVCVCVTPPGHTKNDTDLNFGTHTPEQEKTENLFGAKQNSRKFTPKFSRHFYSFGPNYIHQKI